MFGSSNFLPKKPIVLGNELRKFSKGREPISRMDGGENPKFQVLTLGIGCLMKVNAYQAPLSFVGSSPFSFFTFNQAWSNLITLDLSAPPKFSMGPFCPADGKRHPAPGSASLSSQGKGNLCGRGGFRSLKIQQATSSRDTLIDNTHYKSEARDRYQRPIINT